MENRVFFPQAALDHWMSDGSAELLEGQLTLGEGRRFSVIEALHVLREVSGVGDHLDLIGRVKSRSHLAELGAEIVETSMLLGEAAYDVEPGWIGVPVGSFPEYRVAVGRRDAGEGAGPGPASDEELLTRLSSTGVDGR